MSERRRYLIEVEMDTVNLTGNGEWCSVRIPSNGPCVIPVRFRDLRDTPPCERFEALRDRVMGLKRERDDARDRVSELERECRKWEGSWYVAREKRDEARREAADLGARCQELEAQRDAYEVEADKAHGEAEQLSAKNERLRQLVDRLEDPEPGWPQPAESDRPAPQTHYREHDVILALDKREARLRRLVEAFDDDAQEVWDLEDGGRIHLTPGCVHILERDGTPTDAGLRRLAERAFGDDSLEWLPHVTGWQLHDDGVYVGRQMSDDMRCKVAEHMRLHAALREMGGA